MTITYTLKGSKQIEEDRILKKVTKIVQSIHGILVSYDNNGVMCTIFIENGIEMNVIPEAVK